MKLKEPKTKQGELLIGVTIDYFEDNKAWYINNKKMLTWENN